MSILQEVMDEYGISETLQTPTDKTDTSSGQILENGFKWGKSKTSGSSVSGSLEDFKTKKTKLTTPLPMCNRCLNAVARHTSSSTTTYCVDMLARRLWRFHYDLLRKAAGARWAAIWWDPDRLFDLAIVEAKRQVKAKKSGADD